MTHIVHCAMARLVGPLVLHNTLCLDGLLIHQLHRQGWIPPEGEDSVVPGLDYVDGLALCSNMFVLAKTSPGFTYFRLPRTGGLSPVRDAPIVDLRTGAKTRHDRGVVDTVSPYQQALGFEPAIAGASHVAFLFMGDPVVIGRYLSYVSGVGRMVTTGWGAIERNLNIPEWEIGSFEVSSIEDFLTGYDEKTGTRMLVRSIPVSMIANFDDPSKLGGLGYEGSLPMRPPYWDSSNRIPMLIPARETFLMNKDMFDRRFSGLSRKAA